MHKDIWPTAKEPGEIVVNPSYDKQIEDHLIDELLVAMEHKDASKLRETLVALIQHIKFGDSNEEKP